jgi:predicted transcriptional regulator
MELRKVACDLIHIVVVAMHRDILHAETVVAVLATRLDQRAVSVDTLSEVSKLPKPYITRAVSLLVRQGLLLQRKSKKRKKKEEEKLYSKSVVGREREEARKSAPDHVEVYIDPQYVHDSMTICLDLMRKRLLAQESTDHLTCDHCTHRVQMTDMLLDRLAMKDHDKANPDSLIRCVRCDKGFYRGGGGKNTKASVTMAELNTALREMQEALLRLRKAIADAPGEEEKKKKENTAPPPPSVQKPQRTKEEIRHASKELNEALGMDLVSEVESAMMTETTEEEKEKEKKEEDVRQQQIMEQLQRQDVVFDSFDFDDDEEEEEEETLTPAVAAASSRTFLVQGVPRDFAWSTEEEQQQWLNEMTEEERIVYEQQHQQS